MGMGVFPSSTPAPSCQEQTCAESLGPGSNTSTPLFQLSWLFLGVSSVNETKANFPHANLGDFTVASVSSWELNELVQPRLKLAAGTRLIDGKRDSSTERLQEALLPKGVEVGTGDSSLPWSPLDSERLMRSPLLIC